MNKSYLKLLLAATCLFFFSGLKAQPYVSISGDITSVATPAMSHDSTTCSSQCAVAYTLHIANSFLGDSVMIIDTAYGSLIYSGTNTTGADPWILTVPLFNLTASDDYVTPGGGSVSFYGPTVKIVSGTDTIHYIDNVYSFFVPNPCIYGTVSGMIYADNNNDCVFNAGDVLLNAMPVEGLAYSTSSSLYPTSGYGTSNPSGNYVMGLQQSWMTNFTAHLSTYYSFIFTPSSCAAATYSFTSLPQTNIDFPLQHTSSLDVECWAGSPANARPNRAFYMQPYVSNIGYTIASGQLTFIKDSRVVYDASLSSNPAVVVSGDTLIWYYSNLTNISGGPYWNNFMSNIHLTPDGTVNIGDTLCFRIFTGVPVGDINPANSDFTICLPVVNSYDPNIKEVSPKGAGVAGNIPASTPDLTYTIHFQNTGTDVAYNISVIDTLDNEVDTLSLKIMGASHYMTPEWLAPGIVKFNFYSINLADSFSNEPLSHGYVRFNIKLHGGLPIGTEITNKAYIYFDSNPPVITNETLNTIEWPSVVSNVSVTSDIQIYPNPATNNIFAEHLKEGKLLILDMSGRMLIDQDITTDKAEIDISKLPGGVYILKTVNKGNTTTRKFVKQ